VKKILILLLAVVLMLFAFSPRSIAEVFYVNVDYFSLSPEPVRIKTGDAVYWVEDMNSVLGPYIITGDWGYDFAPYGIRFNLPGIYSYTAESAWGGGSWSGTVVVSVNLPPTVSITNPTNGAVFVAPAGFSFEANADDPNPNDVMDVEFWLNGTMVDDVYTPPYATAVTNLAAGTYQLKAVAWDYSGATVTNSITVQVVNPPPVSLGGCSVVEGKILFTMNNAASGSTNVLECSTNLTHWQPILTNISDGAPLSITNAPIGPVQFFRVRQLQ